MHDKDANKLKKSQSGCFSPLITGNRNPTVGREIQNLKLE